MYLTDDGVLLGRLDRNLESNVSVMHGIRGRIDIYWCTK